MIVFAFQRERRAGRRRKELIQHSTQAAAITLITNTGLSLYQVFCWWEWKTHKYPFIVEKRFPLASPGPDEEGKFCADVVSCTAAQTFSWQPLPYGNFTNNLNKEQFATAENLPTTSTKYFAVKISTVRNTRKHTGERWQAEKDPSRWQQDAKTHHSICIWAMCGRIPVLKTLCRHCSEKWDTKASDFGRQ